MLHIIDAVVALLKERFAALSVEYFPESPEKYRLNAPVGALLVSYPGSEFERTSDSEHVAQERYIHVTVNVVMRQLNGRSGAVAMSEDVLQVLAGFQAPGCSKFSATGVKFLGIEGGLWSYAVHVAATTLFVANEIDPEETAGLIKRITFVGGLTGEEIHVPRPD